MKHAEAPPRLRHHPEFGELIARAAKHEIATEQIIATGVAINEGIGVASTGLTLLGGKATTKWLVISALAAGGITGGLVYSNQSSLSVRESPTVQTETYEPEVTPPRAPIIEKVEPPAPKPAPRVPKPQSPRKSQLAEQVRLFDRARGLAKRGDHVAALGVLERLLERFPDSHLRSDVGMVRVSCLLAENRLDAAHAEIESLLSGEISVGKKAQLLRLVGDIWMRKESCQKAVMAYRRALGLGLPEDDTESVQNAIRKCLQKN